MRSIMVSAARRRVGLAGVQAMARRIDWRGCHMLVGATRAVSGTERGAGRERVMDARRRFRQDQRDRQAGGGAAPEWVHLAQDVYEVIARAQGHPGA